MRDPRKGFTADEMNAMRKGKSMEEVLETASPEYPSTAFEHAVEAALDSLLAGHPGPFVPTPDEVRRALVMALFALANNGANFESDRPNSQEWRDRVLGEAADAERARNPRLLP